MGMNPVSLFLLSFFCVLSSVGLFCNANNTITRVRPIREGESLISENKIFELGFFSPENSTLRYVGIWYHNIQPQTVVWVANREAPISDDSGVFTIGGDGNLVISSANETLVWSSRASILSGNETTAVLADTGNFILSRSDSIGDIDKAYWQSFRDPTDTFLPHMRAYVHSDIGEIRPFTSWRSRNDPSLGNYSMSIDSRGAPQIVILDGSKRRWRSGHWNSQIFLGIPNMTLVANYLYGFKLNNDGFGNVYFTYIPNDSSHLLRFHLKWDGMDEQLRWDEDAKQWQKMQSQPANECEIYNYCGNFTTCSVFDSPKCRCMDGFEPTRQEQWRRGNWTDGCKRKTQSQCQRNGSVAGGGGGEDGFKALTGMKLPDFADMVRLTASETCKEQCSANCSCIAYANVPSIGCLIWSENLVDVQHFDKGGSSFFLRLADSELGGKRKLSTPLIVVIAFAGVFFLGIFIWFLLRLKEKLKVLPASIPPSLIRNSEMPVFEVSKEYSTDLSGPAELLMVGNDINGPELPMFSFDFVAASTNNFSEENKLGQGGFGPVYKGKLPGGQDVAVKRLSRKSGQGLEEFKNEIILIAKLQHRNLVRLLGCCIMGEEKMLLYEYMPNKSLDCFLFDPAQQTLLDWNKRFIIILGIARGLLYLHRDSRLRIIHRDLKASNILLDEDMNPKISDFGMARIFGVSENEANTNRVVGTYGYMAPEYAMEGLFSVKSDVYSFGVLLLEIVGGRRNTSFRLTEQMTLVAHAWDLWSERKAMELVDLSIQESCSPDEVLRCIHVGMLCVQDSASSRPSMDSVLLMLESETATLPLPRQPTFTSMRSSLDTETFAECQESHEIASSKELTV
ncbi:putative G-type lectin S-receptor-like serine/threonine-protein kinase At1g61610 isoform X2 [Tripterygium wilfordii]|nr:putative G-type lectin S-receptor-like serine/threonine-protein kinase At1g61610 isoform X2 [Tripterygium wilfordii]